MNSDSESQDSDDGRRFRFESTRKDTASLATARRNVSPQRKRRYSRSRSRSRSWDRSSRHSKDDRRSRSSVDCETSNKKDKNSKSNSKEKKKHHKDSHRPKDSDKHKSKHKKRSRERSRERTNLNEENSKRKEEKPESVVEKLEKRKDEETTKRKEESLATTNDHKLEKQKDEGNSKQKEESSVSNGQKQKEGCDKVNERSVEKTQEKYNKLVVSDEMRADAAAPARKKPKSFFERVVNKKAIEEDTSYYGPVLPPQLEKKLLNVRERGDMEQPKIIGNLPSMENDKSPNIGPALPSYLSVVEKNESQSIGPALPSHLLASRQANEDDEKIETDEASNKEDSEEEDTFGPPLPPNLQKRKVIGPVLLDNFVLGETPIHVSTLSPNSKNDEDSDDDGEVVGPLPPDHPAARSQAKMLLEYRALQIQAKFKDKTAPEEKKREEWMTELPPAHAIALGLGSIPRTFRTKEGPDMSDRSMWTDTPADRLRKQKEKEENRFVPSQESSKKSKSKDQDVTQEAKEEKRPESLLDMHLKNLKKKKKKMEKEAKDLGLPTRRPFDRDIDLQANRLDEARKKKIFEKASRLNDRFSAAKML
ncbi:GPALPP motifs-containing protein 1 [Phymastichus coffea]|uniref:GPALPP motifs-containing protein 1 n=1 Tax=Phymastichus coffea TaxID=108790 RepID=UPI00273B72FD|nr:GPALPP motifs-containing protein 1 [Phymastichus coffea]XP_058800420.1 GPALPP motifs-containing protein 1 [Phymastichus coffea]